MQTILGWVLVVIPGMLLAGQFVSVINFPLAQKLGLQEKAGTADALKLRAELYTACWDIPSLVWLPVAGVMMLADHAWWPQLSLIGGAVFVDTAGREAAKNLSMRAGGIRIGTVAEQRLEFITYILMALLGLVTIIYALDSLAG